MPSRFVPKMAEPSPIIEQVWELIRCLVHNASYAAQAMVEAELEQEKHGHKTTQDQCDDFRRQNCVLGDILTEFEEQVPKLEAEIREKEDAIRELQEKLRKANRQAEETYAYLRQLEHRQQELDIESAMQRRQATKRESDLKWEVKVEKEWTKQLDLERQSVIELLMQNIHSQRIVHKFFLHYYKFEQDKILSHFNLLLQHRVSSSIEILHNASSQSHPQTQLPPARPSKAKETKPQTQKRESKMADFDKIMTDASPLDPTFSFLDRGYIVDEDMIMRKRSARPAAWPNPPDFPVFTLPEEEDVQMFDCWTEDLTAAMTSDEDAEMIDVDCIEREGDETLPQHHNVATCLQTDPGESLVPQLEPVLIHPIPIPPRKKRTVLSRSRARVGRAIKNFQSNRNWKRMWQELVEGFLQLLRVSTLDVLLFCSFFVLFWLCLENWAYETWFASNEIPIAIASELRNKRVMEQRWFESFAHDMFEWLEPDRSLMG